MTKEDVKIKIKEELGKMGCTEIAFPESKDNLVVATFNCRAVTSFVADIAGWTYSGIHLDPTKNRQYKIDFVRT